MKNDISEILLRLDGVLFCLPVLPTGVDFKPLQNFLDQVTSAGGVCVGILCNDRSLHPATWLH